jgi:hypothetical protein
MGANTQTPMDECATTATCLGGGARVDSDHLMSSLLSFGFKNGEKCAPGGVHDAFGQVMVFDHPRDM